MVPFDPWARPSFVLAAEQERTKQRESLPHLTYDCFHAKVEGDRVRCAKGHLIGPKKGSMMLAAVLQGQTPGVCEECPDFEE